MTHRMLKTDELGHAMRLIESSVTLNHGIPLIQKFICRKFKVSPDYAAALIDLVLAIMMNR